LTTAFEVLDAHEICRTAMICVATTTHADPLLDDAARARDCPPPEDRFRMEIGDGPVVVRRPTMRRTAVLAALVLAAQGLAALPSLAQQPSDPERLLRIIEEQQRRLDAQAAQLAEQQKALEELRKEVRALQGGRPPAATPPTAAAPPPAATPPPTPAPAPAPTPPAATPPRLTWPTVITGETPAPAYPGVEDAKTAAAAAAEAWPGSFGLEGIDTRVKLSGFVELDVVHDTNAIATPSAFVTQAIVTRDATAAQGADGQTSASVQATRFELETRTPFEDRRVRTYFTFDLFNDFTSTSPEFRLRQAYGEVSNILLGGDLLLGQDWSTFTNLYAVPNTLDFQGPNALFGTRHPLLRWTRTVGPGWTLKLAAEAPDLRIFEGASPASRWPDGVVALGWQNDAVNLQGGFVARDLRASGAGGGVVTDFGWGATLAGRLHMPGSLKQDFAVFSLTYGEGIGGLLNDTPPDASYDPATNRLKALPTLAWYVGYQHWWTPKFYSAASYGWITEDTQDFQAPTAYKKTQYVSANLTWTPFRQWLFGVEVLYGTREDKDGARGEVVRTVFTTRFSF